MSKDHPKGPFVATCERCEAAFEIAVGRAGRPRKYCETCTPPQAALKARMTANRDRVAALKADPCHDCGRWFPSCSMDFDHRDPTSKRADVGTMMSYSWEAITTEIAKCDLVCANCHRIRTHQPD